MIRRFLFIGNFFGESAARRAASKDILHEEQDKGKNDQNRHEKIKDRPDSIRLSLLVVRIHQCSIASSLRTRWKENGVPKGENVPESRQKTARTKMRFPFARFRFILRER